MKVVTRTSAEPLGTLRCGICGPDPHARHGCDDPAVRPAATSA